MRVRSKALPQILCAGLLVLTTPALAAPPSPLATVPNATDAAHVATTTREGSIRSRLGKDVAIRFAPGQDNALRSLTGLRAPTRGATVRERAERFLREHRDIFDLSGPSDVMATDHTSFARRLGPSSTGPGHVVRLRMTHHGLPVEGRDLVVSLDTEDRVTSVKSDLGPLVVPTPTREITADDAVAIARSTFVIVATGAPQKVIIANGSAGRIAWRVPVSLAPLAGFHTVWVDIEDGRILREARVGHDHGLVLLPRQPHAVEAE